MVSNLNHHRSTELTESFTKLALQPLLFEQLLAQLNKDFALSGCEGELSLATLPEELVNEVQHLVSQNMKNSFFDLRDLLYRIDVSEKKITSLDFLNLEAIVALILEREVSKVWIRNQYSNRQSQ